jgi:hypothetical protein
MKNILIVLKNMIVMLIFSIIFSSCIDDFLDKAPLSDLSPEEYLWDESHLASYTIARYSMFPTHQTASFGTFGIDANTDNMASQSFNVKYVPGQWRVSQSGSDWSFSNIYQCNYFLNTVLPRWKNGEITGSSASNIKHYIGEMYFLRAYEYFNKVQALGDFPIIKENLPNNIDVLVSASKRMPRTEVVRFIISDLDSAILLMSTKSPDGLKNRLSQDCAYLFKSRVALYEATWLKYFEGTPFVPNGRGWPGANKDYNKDYQFQAGDINGEINWLLDQAISSSKIVADKYELTLNNKVLQQSLSDPQNPYFDMFSAVDMSGFSEVLFWRKYDKGLKITHNVPVMAQLGNYGVGLTKGMVDGFLMNNGLPIYAENSGYLGDNYIANVRNNRDGRLWLFLKEPGQKNILYNEGQGSNATPVELIPDITNSSIGYTFTTGYTIRKGLSYDAQQCYNNGGYTGCIVFRATEAYLNYMEAYYERHGGLDVNAQNYWIKIRERAGVDADYQKTINATDISKEAANDWGAYSAGKLLTDPTLYNIRRERRCELMAEGLRDMDLKRWRAKDQMISSAYHIQGFKLWGPMQSWYIVNGNSILTYGTASSNVSAPSRSIYLLPYEKTGKELVYNGYRWAMAHYLSPIASRHFLDTSIENDISTSPIYQNPGWPTDADKPAIGY